MTIEIFILSYSTHFTFILNSNLPFITISLVPQLPLSLSSICALFKMPYLPAIRESSWALDDADNSRRRPSESTSLFPGPKSSLALDDAVDYSHHRPSESGNPFSDEFTFSLLHHDASLTMQRMLSKNASPCTPDPEEAAKFLS